MKTFGTALRYLGIFWLVVALGRTIGRIEGASAAIGFFDALAVVNWIVVAVNLMLAGAAIWAGGRLEARSAEKLKDVSHPGR